MFSLLKWCATLLGMTQDELVEGIKLTVAVAHELKADLKRLPRGQEIQWRVAAKLRETDETLEQAEAMELAASLIEIVATTYGANNDAHQEAAKEAAKEAARQAQEVRAEEAAPQGEDSGDQA